MRKFKRKHKWWFNPSSLVNQKKVLWYPGRYLHTMHKILQLIAVFSLLPVIIIPLQFQFDSDFNTICFFRSDFWGIKELSVYTSLLSTFTIMSFVVTIRHITSRRQLLESGLLSIHSCAVIWQAVLIAHVKALNMTNNDQNLYLKKLAQEAEKMKKHAISLDKWLRNIMSQSTILFTFSGRYPE